MALVLSQWIGIDAVYFTSKYASVWIIHNTYVQQVAVVMYSASMVDKEMEPCFLLSQATKELPKKNAPPLVLFLSSTKFAQSASE